MSILPGTPDAPNPEPPTARRKSPKRVRRVLLLLVALPLMIISGVPLALSLRPPPRTVRLVATIPLPGRSLLAVTDYVTVAGGSLYVGYSSRSRLVRIDTRTNQVTATIDGLPGIHGFAASQGTLLGFTSNGGDNTVGVVGLGTNRRLSNIPCGADPDAIISDDKDRLIYVANHTGRTATLIDPADRKALGDVPLGGEAEFAQADPVTGLVYQNLEDTDEVVVVDPQARTVIARYKTAPGEGPTGLSLDAANHRLFCVCGNKTLVVLNAATGQRIASLPIGAGVDGVGYDPALKRIYTANGSGTMTVIQQDTPDHYRVVENAPTPLGGHTLTVDPATHRVYVVCAGLGSAKVVVFEPVL